MSSSLPSTKPSRDLSWYVSKSSLFTALQDKQKQSSLAKTRPSFSQYQCILYGQKCRDALLNYWIRVFYSDLLSEVFKIKHVAMQSAFTKQNKGSKELCEFKHGTLIWCHYNKPVCYIPQSTVVVLLMYYWKHLGTAATQPWTEDHVKPQNEVTECWGVWWRFPNLTLALISAQKLCGKHFMEWVSMTGQLHVPFTSPSTMPSAEWTGVMHATTGPWSSGNMFCKMMNHISLFCHLIGDRVWKMAGEHYLPEWTVTTVKFGGGEILVFQRLG